MNNSKFFAILLVAFLIAAVTIPAVPASGAALTSLSDTLTRLQTSTAADHTIVFTTPTGVDASSDTITVTFESGFTMGSVAFGDVDLADDGTDKTLAATAAAGTWGAAVSGQVLTLTAPTDAGGSEIAAGSVITIQIGTNATFGTTGTNQITNPGSAASYEVSIAGTFGDTGSIGVGITAADQVSVTANVDSSITFTITGTSVTLSNITTAAVASSNQDDHLTVSTNADDGYTISGDVTSTSDTLSDGTNTISWTSDGTASLTAGTEEWGVLFAAGSGGRSGSTSNASNYRALDTSENVVTNSTGPVSDDDTQATYGVAVAGTTESGAYTATVTYLATANY